MRLSRVKLLPSNRRILISEEKQMKNLFVEDFFIIK